MPDSTQPEQFTVDYFIQKFEAIPEEKWTTGVFSDGDKCCAGGHCGMKGMSADMEEFTSEYTALTDLCDDITSINDGGDSDYQQKTPKLRILAALQDLKAKGVK